MSPCKRFLWAAAGRPCPGEVESGDLYLVRTLTEGLLAVVVDALGHGKEAAAIARRAVGIFAEAGTLSLTALFALGHERLHGSRGVVASAARIDADGETVTWLGVGNVEGRLLRRREESNGAAAGAARKESKDRLPAVSHEALLLRGGVLGYQIPVLASRTLPIRPGDTLIFATDGIRSGFADIVRSAGPPLELAERIIGEYYRGVDDALALVVRYRGRG